MKTRILIIAGIITAIFFALLLFSYDEFFSPIPNNQLIENSQTLKGVQTFLERYPDAKTTVHKGTEGEKHRVVYRLDIQNNSSDTSYILLTATLSTQGFPQDLKLECWNGFEMAITSEKNNVESAMQKYLCEDQIPELHSIIPDEMRAHEWVPFGVPIIIEVPEKLEASKTLTIQDDEITYIPKNTLPLQTEEIDSLVAEASFNCGKSLDEIQSQTPFDILTPKVLPEGYSLRNTDNAAPGRILLFYSDGNVCGYNAKGLDDGVIEMVVAFSPDGIEEEADGESFLNYYKEKFEKNNLDYQTIVTKNGLYIIGTGVGIGKSITIDENDNIIHEEEFDDPARVYVIDKESGVGYLIRAFMPVDDLLKIAQSLS